MTTYEVHTGRPSWHQARAGALSAGIMEFATLALAKRYMAGFKLYHPGEPVFIMERNGNIATRYVSISVAR